MKRINQENINTKENMDLEFKNSGWLKEFDYTDKERYDKFLLNFKGGSLLDLGCWNTPTALEAKKRFLNSSIYCLDISEEVIKHFSLINLEINYLQADCNEKLPFINNFFDYIIAGEIIEHLENPQEFINEILRVLKAGGYFVFSTPDSEMFKQKSVGGKWHLWSFEEEDFKKLLDNKGELLIEKEQQKQVITLIGSFKKK